MTLQAAAALTALIGLVGQFAQLNYLSKLAVRIPDMASATRARVLMWGIGISYGMILIFGLVMALMLPMIRGGGSASGLLAPIGCVGGFAALALLIFTR